MFHVFVSTTTNERKEYKIFIKIALTKQADSGDLKISYKIKKKDR